MMSSQCQSFSLITFCNFSLIGEEIGLGNQNLDFREYLSAASCAKPWQGLLPRFDFSIDSTQRISGTVSPAGNSRQIGLKDSFDRHRRIGHIPFFNGGFAFERWLDTVE